MKTMFTRSEIGASSSSSPPSSSQQSKRPRFICRQKSKDSVASCESVTSSLTIAVSFLFLDRCRYKILHFYAIFSYLYL